MSAAKTPIRTKVTPHAPMAPSPARAMARGGNSTSADPSTGPTSRPLTAKVPRFFSADRRVMIVTSEKDYTAAIPMRKMNPIDGTDRFFR